MRRAGGITILAACLATASCALLRPSDRRAGGATRDGALQTTFLYTEGMKHALTGRKSDAEAIFKKVVSTDSTHAPSFYELASLAAETDLPRAIGYSRRACRLDTANLWYKGQLGNLLLVSRQYGQALDIYRDLVRRAPYNPENHRVLAALYQQQGQPFTAISLLDSAQYRLGRIDELSNLRRQLLIETGLYDRAITETRNMIADAPWDDSNYRILGGLYDRAGKDSLALAAYTKAAEINPDDIETIVAMNDFYRRKGDWPNFFATARRMIESDDITAGGKVAYINELMLNRGFYSENFFQIKDLISSLFIKYPDNYDVIDLYGGSMIASAGAEQGLAFYKSQLRRPEAPIEIYNTVLDIETYLKRPDSLAKYTALALKRFPENVDLYLRMGSAQSFLDRDDKALEAYRHALKYSRTDSIRSVVTGMIGDQYYKQENARKTFALYDKALRLWPDNATILNNYSYYLSTDGPGGRDISRAVAMAEKATALSPGNPTFLDTYAWALFKAGRLAEAKKVMLQAVSLDTTGSEVLYLHYGDILFAMGEKFMATVYWRKALEKGYDKEEIDERLKKAESK